MRIGLITGEYPPMQGGVGDYTRFLAREMVVQGHDVFVLTHPDGRDQGDGVHVTAKITNWNRAFLTEITRWSKHHQLDVINLQYQTAAYNMAGTIHLLTYRFRHYVTTFHDTRFPYLFPKANGLRPYVVKLMAKLSTGVIVTDRADEYLLQPVAKNIERIPIGANFDPLPANENDIDKIRAKIGDGALIVGYFGFLNASKGIDTLLNAAKIVQEKNIPIRIMMIGGRTGASDPTNQQQSEAIDRLAASLGLDLFWTGFVAESEIAPYFAAADVIALPFRDGASLRRGSLMAALAYGCAIITTFPDVKLPELEESVIYIPVGNEKALAEQLIRLAQHPAERLKLGAAAKQASTQFTWDQIAKRTLDFYQKISHMANM